MRIEPAATHAGRVPSPVIPSPVLRSSVMPSSVMLGIAGGLLQFAAAVKGLRGASAPGPDSTLVLGAIVASLLAWRLVTIRHRLGADAMLGLAACALLLGWLVLSAGWSSSADVARQKGMELALIAPPMLLCGAAIAASDTGFRAFTTTLILFGAAVGVVFALGRGVLSIAAITGEIALGDFQYQITALLVASAATLLVAHAVTASAALHAPLLAAALLVGAACPLIGGRAALLGLVAGAAAACLAGAWTALRPSRLILPSLLALGVVGTLALVSDSLSRQAGVATLARLDQAMLARGLSVRLSLWLGALGTGDTVTEALFGLGLGGFAPVAGFGDSRGWHPHNLILETLAESGLVGLGLLAITLGFAGLACLRAWPRLAGFRAAALAGIVCLAASQLLTSSDLGNRMAWLWLGLVLGHGMEAEDA